jgi:hypothetical protein
LAVSTRFDARAIRAGASVCLVFAIPFSLGARWAADSRDDEGLATLLSVGALIGFVIGSGVAAWLQQRDYPLVHGIVTAVGTYVIAQIVFITIRGVLGREIHWYAAVFNIAPVLGAGLIGGALGSRLQRKGITPGMRAGR